MQKYIFYRLIFIFITLFLIVLVNFTILHSIKVGAFETAVINLEYNKTGAKVDSDTMQSLKTYFALDENLPLQFLKTFKNYLFFDFGVSYFTKQPVILIILDKMKVSLVLGFFSTIFLYLISITLGYLKTIQGKIFDNISTLFLVILYIIPTIAMAGMVILLFDNSSFFVIGGVASENFSQLSLLEKIKDFTAHMLLPILINVCGGLLFITIFAKNIFLSQKQKTYYIFAKYKGSSSFNLFKNHLLKNSMLIIFADISSIFLGILFGGSLFIEILFSLDGIGLLSYESIINKDYPIVLGTIYLLSFLGLFLRLLNDIIIFNIDKRLKMYENTF
ncbi:MAG: ABC transporter permease subunit [Alphaproteobacteria bacterium]|jgi:microcin C transport system permease protein|nr:ABC transporter permease subunit [Alphaproteobacteria bacterium]